MQPFTLYVVRHGESEWNRRGLVQGQSPEAGGLTDRGVLDAAAAGAQLRALGVNPDVIVSSDLQRAFETAVIIGDALDRPIRVDRSFREQQYGALEGLHLDDVIDGVTVRSLIGALWRDPSNGPEGGESVTEMSERVVHGLSQLGGCAEFVVVCHGGPMRALGDRARNVEMAPRLRGEVPNGSIATFMVTVGDVGITISTHESDLREPRGLP